MSNLEAFLRILESSEIVFNVEKWEALDNRTYITMNPDSKNICIACFDNEGKLIYIEG